MSYGGVREGVGGTFGRLTVYNKAGGGGGCVKTLCYRGAIPMKPMAGSTQYNEMYMSYVPPSESIPVAL